MKTKEPNKRTGADTALTEWLVEKQNGHCLWAAKPKGAQFRVEGWMLRGPRVPQHPELAETVRLVIVQWFDVGGWNLYIDSSMSANTEESLRDAERAMDFIKELST